MINPRLPTAYPNLKNKIAPKMVEIAVIKTGAVPKLPCLLVNEFISMTSNVRNNNP